jgi:imidazole glycerol phosphate synthase glutamine amidotransferase subunit
MEVDLIEIGIGNIGSVKRCLDNLGIDFRTVNVNNQPDGSRPLVLPGVGQFGAVMKALKQNEFDSCIRNLILKGTPYLGICIGLQILLERSEESKETPGLGLIKGEVIRFQNGKVPQIGWNLVRSTLEQTTERQYAYFVNSYYALPALPSVVSYTANYFGEFCAAIKTQNITAVQFHPEKSAEFGMKFLKGWASSVN